MGQGQGESYCIMNNEIIHTVTPVTSVDSSSISPYNRIKKNIPCWEKAGAVHSERYR